MSILIIKPNLVVTVDLLDIAQPMLLMAVDLVDHKMMLIVAIDVAYSTSNVASGC